MSKELVISANRHETKLAVLEDDQLVELYFQRENEYSLGGSIHKGRVTRVLPGMQSAFVDLGLERDTFLYVSDFFEENTEDYDRVTGPEERGRRPERGGSKAKTEAAPQPQAAAAVAASPVSSAPPPAERGEENGGRDRRGRRSRRRRNRGRGFPESKYASDAPAQAEARDAEEESETPAEAPTSDLIVLPGESLAKYRGRDAEDVPHHLDPAEPEESEADEPAEPAGPRGAGVGRAGARADLRVSTR